MCLLTNVRACPPCLLEANQKVSMLKRLVEQEYADLFPNDPTFICAKLQDEFGYSLSNASLIFELVKNGDRLFAVPEAIGGDLGMYCIVI